MESIRDTVDEKIRRLSGNLLKYFVPVPTAKGTIMEIRGKMFETGSLMLRTVDISQLEDRNIAVVPIKDFYYKLCFHSTLLEFEK